MGLGAHCSAVERALRHWRVGCDCKTPTGVEGGMVALRTVTGLRGRRRKGLKPSRRLSETTGPRSPGAFRVVVPAAEVTKWAARCKRPAAFSTPVSYTHLTLPTKRIV